MFLCTFRFITLYF